MRFDAATSSGWSGVLRCQPGMSTNSRSVLREADQATHSPKVSSSAEGTLPARFCSVVVNSFARSRFQLRHALCSHLGSAPRSLPERTAGDVETGGHRLGCSPRCRFVPLELTTYSARPHGGGTPACAREGQVPELSPYFPSVGETLRGETCMARVSRSGAP